MISVEHLTISFGAKPLFSDANFVVGDRDRIALTGKNGAGKTSLLRVLCGEAKPTSGNVAFDKGMIIGYLPQTMALSDSQTVRQEASKAFSELLTLQNLVSQLNSEIAQRDDYESDSYQALIERFAHADERFRLLGGDNYEAQLERTLVGLGFRREDLDRPTAEFSGGWRMRIELAKILLRKPDVLLLDEPTNHLDIESIQWLEQYILSSGCALVLVSHDRAFINNVTTRTLEISAGKIEDYRVKYDDYVRLRRERREQQIRAYENQQREINAMKDFIDRFRYKPTKAVQVQSKIKQLQKLVPIEIDEIDRPAMQLRFPPCLRSGDFPLICDGVSKRYGDNTVFRDVNLTLRRGEKVAFVGRNGEGKTTLVRCIMGQIPYDGNLKLGHQVQVGYFAQNQAQLLDEDATIFETVDRVARGDIRLRLNDILGAFLFGGEIAEKKVKVLSGGERSRLAMIKLLLEPVNFLILDEPTNHLDMQSKEVLKEALRAFDGTAILVSHDREFLDGIVTKVYEFSNQRVREHIGGIYDFLQAKKISSLNELSTPSTQNPTTETVEPSQKKQDYEKRKQLQRDVSKIEKQIARAEEKISTLENRISELDALLSQPENASDLALVNEYTAISQQLSDENDRWMELSEKLEQLKQTES